MNARVIARWVATALGSIVLTPFFQAPATKLAERLQFDGVLAERWEPLMQWLSNLSQNIIYVFLAGGTVGLACGMWIDGLLRRRTVASRQPSKPTAARALLRLKFSGRAEPPELILEENIQSWFVYWSGATKINDQHGNIIVETPVSWAIFITFINPVEYKQIVTQFSSGQPVGWQVRQTLQNVCVVTIDTGLAACEMEITTRN